MIPDGVVGGVEGSNPAEASCVHQDIEAAHHLTGLEDSLLTLGWILNVALHGADASDFIDPVDSAGARDHVGAMAHELGGKFSADTA
jgi:hypothetical protein